MVSTPTSRPLIVRPQSYPTMVPPPAAPAERGPQVLLQDTDARRMPRAVAPSSAGPGAADAVPAPEPTAPIGQSP